MDYLQTNRKQVYIAGLVIGRGKKSNLGGIFRDKITVIFRANLAGKQSVKKRQIFVVIFRANFARNRLVLF